MELGSGGQEQVKGRRMESGAEEVEATGSSEELWSEEQNALVGVGNRLLGLLAALRARHCPYFHSVLVWKGWKVAQALPPCHILLPGPYLPVVWLASDKFGQSLCQLPASRRSSGKGLNHLLS